MGIKLNGTDKPKVSAKKVKPYLYKDIGILLCIIFYICFLTIVFAVKPYLKGAGWYFFSSLHRIIFGLAELLIFIKIFHKNKWTDVINFSHFKAGVFAGSGSILYTILFAAAIFTGVGSLVNITFMMR